VALVVVVVVVVVVDVAAVAVAVSVHNTAVWTCCTGKKINSRVEGIAGSHLKCKIAN